MQFDNIHVAFFTSTAPDTGEEQGTARLVHERIHYFDGQRMEKDALRSFWPKPSSKTVVAWCGPPSFNEHIDELARDMYYLAENCFTF